MNKIVVVLLVAIWALWFQKAWCVIPAADAILLGVVEKSPLKNLKDTKLNAIVSVDDDKEAKTLELNASGLSLGKQVIELYVLNVLIKAKNLQELKAYLATHKVDTSVVSLGFFGNEPAYIIGAKPGDTKSAQLWVDKTNWTIVKEIAKNHEVIFDKWSALNSPGARFPRLINLKIGQTKTSYAMAEMPN